MNIVKSKLFSGLLFKGLMSFITIACLSFVASYYFANQKQDALFESELKQVKMQTRLSVDSINKQHLAQLVLAAEEIMLLSDLHKQSFEKSKSELERLWPRLQFTFSLASLGISSETSSFVFGDKQPAIVEIMKSKTLINLQPSEQIFCELTCQMSVSIPVQLDSEQAVFTLVAQLYPSVLAMNNVLGLDIGVLNGHKGEGVPLENEEYPNFEKYRMELLTNVEANQALFFYFFDKAYIDEIISNGAIVKLNNNDMYIWTSSFGDENSGITYLFIRNINNVSQQNANQIKSLLVYAIILSCSILAVIVALSIFPLTNIRHLTKIITLIGKNDYQTASKELGGVKPKLIPDELSRMEYEFDMALNKLISYEAQITNSQQQLRIQATVDSTTSLYNRNAFIEDMQVLATKPSDTVISILFLDLDGFKPVNDNLGHEVGDVVLAQVGQRLMELSDTNIKIYRIGGDEFTICYTGIIEEKALLSICTHALSIFANPFLVFENAISITVSIGVSSGSIKQHHYSEILRRADIAMYQAKKEGKNRYCLFHNNMMEHANLRFSIANEFKNGLENNEFSLHFQPIVNAKSHKLEKLEALCRWHHPRLGHIRPDIFVAVLEETKHMDILSQWLMKEALQRVHMLDAMGLNEVKVSVNISGIQVINPNSVATLEQACIDANVSPSRIELEITETAMISNFNLAKEWVEAVKEIGFNVAIDDFGTGYSSLSYLTAFPFDTVKIDRSLVCNIETDPNQKKITQSITNMLHGLGVSVVVEGVETQTQLSIVTQIGVDHIQGYLFSKPLAPGPLRQSLEEYKESLKWQVGQHD